MSGICYTVYSDNKYDNGLTRFDEKEIGVKYVKEQQPFMSESDGYWDKCARVHLTKITNLDEYKKARLLGNRFGNAHLRFTDKSGMFCVSSWYRSYLRENMVYPFYDMVETVTHYLRTGKDRYSPHLKGWTTLDVINSYVDTFKQYMTNGDLLLVFLDGRWTFINTAISEQLTLIKEKKLYFVGELIVK